MADAQLQIVIDAVDNASKDLNNLKKQLKGITTETDKTKKATGNLADGFKSFLSTAGMVAAGVTAGYFALKKFYDIARQGAELQFVEDRFNRLAESVGTTADVLLGDLREATKGLRSDSELMASATDFMALGFAKTADEAVRLATVAGALNMNMNQLVLTLANQTTMRFDQLGVAVEGFDERLKALKASGIDANAAFQEAFLQQAEEQIKKVGGASESSIGSFMRLEAAVKNLTDSLKSGIAKDITDLMNAYDRLNDAVAKYNEESENSIAAAPPLVKSLSDTNKQIEYLEKNYKYAGNTVDMLSENMIEQAILMRQTRDATLSAREGVLAFGLASEQTAGMVDNFLEKAQIFKDDFGEAFDVASLLDGSVGAVKRLMSELGLLGVKYTELRENLDLGFTAANLRLNVTINTLKESLAGGLKDALDNAKLSIDKLKEGYAGIDQLFGTGFKLQLELELAGEEFEKGFINALKKGKLQEFLSTNGEAFIQTTMKLDADVIAAKTAIAELEEVKAAVLTAGLLMINALIDDAKVKEWKAPTKYGTVIYTPRVEEFPDTGGGGNPANGQPVYAQAAGGITLPHYWVGELGPEPFFPETNGRIVSNTQAVNALRSGGGGGEQAINVVINTPFNFADRVWAEREIGPFIRDAMRKAGK